MPMRELQRIQELHFRQLIGGAFDHDDVVFGADVDQVEVTMHAIGVSGIGNELAVDAADPNRTDWSLERNVGNAQCGGGAVDRQNIRIVFAIGAEQNGNNLSVVKVALRKERAQWPVGHARGERLLFCGTSLAFEVTARKLSCRRRFLAVVDGEGEEILDRKST